MAWQKVSAEMCEVLDRAIMAFECQKKMMFGCPAYFVNGNMFAGVHQDSMILRLSEGDRASLFAAFDETGQFEPMPGRPMKEYAVLPEAVYNELPVLREWLARSLQYASALPPKDQVSTRGRRGRSGKSG